MSNIIRVWTLKEPSQERISWLVETIQQITPGQDLDIIYDNDLTVQELKGDGHVNIVTGPGIRVTRDGSVVKVEKESN